MCNGRCFCLVRFAATERSRCRSRHSTESGSRNRAGANAAAAISRTIATPDIAAVSARFATSFFASAPPPWSPPILPGGVPKQISDNVGRQFEQPILPATAIRCRESLRVARAGGLMAGGVTPGGPPPPMNYGNVAPAPQQQPQQQQVASASLGASYGAPANQPPTGPPPGDAPAQGLGLTMTDILQRLQAAEAELAALASRWHRAISVLARWKRRPRRLPPSPCPCR